MHSTDIEEVENCYACLTDALILRKLTLSYFESSVFSYLKHNHILCWIISSLLIHQDDDDDGQLSAQIRQLPFLFLNSTSLD